MALEIWWPIVSNIGQCKGDLFKVPPQLLPKAIFNRNRLGVKTLGLWILANSLLEPEDQLLLPEGQI